MVQPQLDATELPVVSGHPVEVRRSARRRKTLSAFRDGDRIVVMLPAHLSRVREQKLIAEMVERVLTKERTHAKAGTRASDTALAAKARALSERYLDGRARPNHIRWVTNMRHRWGSCTTTDGTIRLSHRLQSMPDYVIDYVLMHELVHLVEPGHSARFWALVARYPGTERGRGYLEGVAAAAQLPELDCGSSDPSSGPAGGSSPVFSADGADSDGSDEFDSADASATDGELPALAVSAAGSGDPLLSVRLDTSSGMVSSDGPP